MTGPRGGKKCADWNRSWTRMRFVTSSVQLVQRKHYQGSSGWAWRHLRRRTNYQTVKYADDLVLMAKEDSVLQGVT